MTAVSAYCTNCSMNFCGACLQRHDRNPLFSGHKTVEKTGGSATGARNIPEYTCKLHPTERAKFLCRRCETIACALCVINSHDGHNVTELDSVLTENKELFNDLQRLITSKIDRMKLKIKEIEALKQMNVASCQKVEMMIKQRAASLVELVRKQEAGLLTELTVMRNERVKLLTEEADDLKQSLLKADSLLKYARTSMERDALRAVALHDDLEQTVRTFADSDSAVADTSLYGLVRFTFLAGEPKLGALEIAKIQPGTALAFAEREEKASMSDSAGGRSNDSGFSSSGVSSRSSRLQQQQSLDNSGQGQGQGQGSSRRETMQSSMPSVPRNKGPVLTMRVERYGANAGELRDPLGVACLTDGKIVVAEWGNKRIQIFDRSGKSITVAGSSKIEPQGVAITLRGNIMVSDSMNKRLEIFTSEGKPMTRWGLGQFFSPCGVTVSPNNNCIVSDSTENKIAIYKSEHQCLGRFGSTGKGDDQFMTPLYVVSGPHNEIVVSDSDNHCVKVFDSKGKFIRKFGSKGSGSGELLHPRGLFVYPDGSVMVADRDNNRVSLFSASGAFVRHLLTADDGIQQPYGLTSCAPFTDVIITECAKNMASLKLFSMSN